jgi:YbbR domain-containing protein
VGVVLRDLLRRWFYENAALKLVALILAITLFILVSGERETERSLPVKIAYVRPDDRVLVSNVPDTIEVWVRGPWTRIKRLDQNDVDPIIVDLTKHTDGEIRFDAGGVRLPAGLTVSAIRPSAIHVAFERVKRVPILPELVGAPPEGYIVERVAAEPAALGVRGGESAVAGLAELRTLPVSVAGKRGPFRQRVALAPVPQGVVVEADAVEVDVQIVEEVRTQRLEAVPVKVRLPPGAPRVTTAVIEPTPAMVEVILRGGAAAMKRLDPRQITVSVDATLGDYAPGTFRTVPVIVAGTPAGIAVEAFPREISLSLRPPAGDRVQEAP